MRAVRYVFGPVDELRAIAERVRGVLLASELVEDVWVSIRGGELVAFVVPRGPFSEQRLREVAHAGVASSRSVGIAVCAMAALPIADGRVDEVKLAATPIADEMVRRQAEETIRAELGVIEARVVWEEARSERAQHVHAFDLWRRPAPGPARALGTTSAPEPGGGGPGVARVGADAPKPSSAEEARAAFADGGPVPMVAGAPSTLPGVLRAAAAQRPDARITFVRSAHDVVVRSYADLLASAERIHGGLVALGLAAGDELILALDRPEDVLPAFWGCLLGGFVPAIAEPPRTGAAALDRIAGALSLFAKPRVIATRSDNAHDSLARALSDRAGRPVHVASIEDLRAHPHVASKHEPRPEDTAFLCLTSGSTGTAKCVMLTHRAILARARGTNAVLKTDANEVALGWLPFDHIGTISDWHLRVVELGASAVYAQKEFVLGRPLAWLDLIDAHRVTGTWAPDFAYRMLADELDRAPDARWDLSCVRTMLTAGETVIARSTERVLARLERHGLARTSLTPAFGMAELGSGVTYQDRPFATHESGGGTFAELGPPIPGASLRIVAPDGSTILPERTPGRLQIRGPVVSPGYYKNPEATRAVFPADGWFDTGDLGFLAGGRLVLTGRAKETLIINGANYHPHEIEAAIESVPGVSPGNTAACAVRRAPGILPPPGSGPERLALFYSGDHVSPREIKKTVAAKIGVSADWLVPVAKDEVPRTAIGKIRRADLARAFEQGRFDARIKDTDFALESASTMPSWFFRPSWIRRDLSALDPTWNRAGALVLCTDAAVAEELAGANVADVVAATTDPLAALLDHLRHPPRELTIAAAPRDVALAGLVRAARNELPKTKLRFVELEGKNAREEARLVLDEARALEKPGDVAIRGGRRHVRVLEPVELTRAPIAREAFVEGGFYLLAGGRGGIGAELAKYLAAAKNARILIIGRASKAKARPPAGAAYATADVTDRAAVERAVAEHEALFGRTLDGILHLAGEYHEARIFDETREGIMNAERPKAEGARVLGGLLASRPNATFTALSSIAGFFGGAGLGAYSMANLELERVVSALRAETGGRASCFAFGVWSGVGMSRNTGAEFLLAAKGYFPISVERGIASLEASLARNESNLAIGLDGAHPEIEKWIAADAGPRRKLVAFVRGEAKPKIIVRARYGTAMECEVRPLERAEDRPAAKRMPESETEKRLAGIWIELLGATSITASDNFFALGGHSLLATQLISRIREAFGVEMEIAKLFESPTIEAVAKAIDDKSSSAPSIAPEAVAALLAEVEGLSTSDLLEMAEEPEHPRVEAMREAGVGEDERASRKLTTIALITGNRPAAAERAVESYLANTRAHKREVELAVFDDSSDPDIHQAYLERLRGVQKRTGVRITCAWIDDKERYARRLAELSAAPYEIIRAAVFRAPPFNYGCGSNRNNALIHTAGEKIFTIDDDTLGKFVVPPSAAEGEGWQLVSNVDPAEYWFFEDREAALAGAKYVERDLFEAHEKYLGRNPIAGSHQPADVTRADARTAARAKNPDARIAITIPGLAGDCGWNVPFGRWGGPLGYLLHDRRSHRRLVESEAKYRAACASRQILRIVDRPTLADDANTMSTFMGIDNGTLIPPFVPTQRAADLILGVTMWTAQERDLIAHMPMGLVHVPVDRRTFWHGEVVRSASGFDSARLFIHLIRMFTPPASADPAVRLRALGKWLFDLGALPPEELRELAERETRRWNEIFLGELRAQLREYADAPAYWRTDVERYAELLESSEKNPDYHLPLDIFSALQDREITRAATQRRIQSFGAILQHWPDIMEAALHLKQRGERLAKPI